MQLHLDMTGTMEQANCRITLRDSVLYEGYVDDLVTLVSGELTLRLNYGKSHSMPSVVKRVGSVFVLV
jgi:hypothetical protein